MEIYFINFCLEWLFKLYHEYIENIKYILKYKFNIQSHIKLISEDSDYKNIFDNIYNKKNKYIFIGNIGHVNNIYEIYNDKKFYYLNIEQMTHTSYYNLLLNLNKDIKIIDYSEENIPYHKKNYKNIYLLPPYFPINMDINKDIDIISLANNEYRKNILDKIDKNLNIKYLDNIFGQERDNIFNRAKIYINIHCSSKHKTMELIRIINLLKKKVIVISQNSIFKDLLFIKDNILIFENIENINFLLNDILRNYNIYFRKIFNNNNLNYYDNFMFNNVKILIND